jgi:hypothetical protein
MRKWANRKSPGISAAKAQAFVRLKKKSPYRLIGFTVGEVEVHKLKIQHFEIVPLAEAIGKRNEEAAEKIRGDSVRKNEPPSVSPGRSHRSFRSGKNAGRAQVQWTRAESVIKHG